MSLRVRIGATEKVSVIDKICIHPTISGFLEDSLTIRHVLRTDVNEPHPPKVGSVANPSEIVAWQDLKELPAVCRKEPRAETQTRRWPKSALRCFNQKVRVLVQKGIGESSGGSTFRECLC